MAAAARPGRLEPDVGRDQVPPCSGLVRHPARVEVRLRAPLIGATDVDADGLEWRCAVPRRERRRAGRGACIQAVAREGRAGHGRAADRGAGSAGARGRGGRRCARAEPPAERALDRRRMTAPGRGHDDVGIVGREAHHRSGRGQRRTRAGPLDQNRLGPADDVRRADLARAGHAQVDGVAVEAHAGGRIAGELEHRPARGHAHAVAVVADELRPGGRRRRRRHAQHRCEREQHRARGGTPRCGWTSPPSTPCVDYQGHGPI